MPQHRAIEWLARYGQRYPRAWDIYGAIMAGRDEQRKKKSNENPDLNWPEWCWCPLTAAHSVVTIQEKRPGYLGPVVGTGELGAVAAWRATQGIYRIDRDLFAELFETPVDGKIPTDVLKRLPEWCVYVEVPIEHEFYDSRVEGFFAFLDYVPPEVPNGDRCDLRLALSLTGVSNLVPMMLELTSTTLDDALEKSAANAALSLAKAQPRTIDEAVQLEKDRAMWTGGEFMEAQSKFLGKALSVLLYLCADETDVPRPSTLPPRSVITKKGRAIIPAAKGPRILECGARLGAELRWAREVREQAKSSETGRSITPHIRAAHWHLFWTGPRDGVRVPKVKWLPPIPVKLNDVPEQPTIRTIR